MNSKHGKHGKRSTDGGGQGGSARTRSFPNVAILRPGRFTDASGREVEFAAAELSAMAAAFDPAGHTPPLTLDHSESGPALGRIGALRWDGQFLRADLEDVEPALASEIEAGRWPARSAEVYAKDSGGVYGLRALSLLGARPPAVKGLPPITPHSSGKGTGPPAQAVLSGGSQLTQNTQRGRNISMHGGCDAD